MSARQRTGVLLAILVLASRGADAQPQDRPPTNTPGERLEVVELDIEGLHAVREADVRALLETRKSPRAPWRDKTYFDPTVFEADLKRLETFYAERGYPHARVEGVINRRGDDEAALRIVVHEGEPVRVADVMFTGFDVLPMDQLNAIRENAPLQPGQPIAFTDVQETARLALNALRNAGYAYARVAVLETMVAPNRVGIELRAEPGLQTVFGPIDIGGNVTVQDPVIRRQLAYLPGQLFRVAAIEESQRRLQRLGLFESIDITIAQSGEPDVWRADPGHRQGG